MARRSKLTDLSRKGARYHVNFYWADVKRAFWFGFIAGNVVLFLILHSAGRI